MNKKMIFVDEVARQTYINASVAAENLEAVYYRGGFNIGHEDEAGNLYDVKGGILLITRLEACLFKEACNAE